MAKEHPLREYRNKAGLTLEELASLAKTSKASISRIETSKQSPRLSLVAKLIKISKNSLSADDFLNT